MRVHRPCVGPVASIPFLLVRCLCSQVSTAILTFVISSSPPSLRLFFSPPDGSSCNTTRRKQVQARGGGRGGAGRGRGPGRGHASRSGYGRGRASGGSLPRPQAKVYQLPCRIGDESTTVAVRAGNAGVYVVTSVNRQRKTSSCSRTDCQG